MLKVAAHAHALRKHIESSLCGPGMLIVKSHFVVDPVANGLHAAPAGFDLSEQFKRNARETVHLAVAAVEQEAENLVRQIADRLLARIPVDLVYFTGVLNERGTAEPELPGGRDEPRAAIPEAVDVMRDFKFRFGAQLVRLQQIGGAGRMNVEKRHHGHGGRNIELNIVCKPNQHFWRPCAKSYRITQRLAEASVRRREKAVLTFGCKKSRSGSLIAKRRISFASNQLGARRGPVHFPCLYWVFL